VSFSALITLRHAGAEVAGMITELPHHQSLALAAAAARFRYDMHVWTRTALRAIHGRPRVDRVELEDLDSGTTRMLDCDLVLFTADWIPDHELAVAAGLEIDPATRGPRVDTALRTSRAGVFAAGTLLAGAEPADAAALSGRHAARAAAAWLADPRGWPAPAVPIACRAPVGWISPNAVGPAREPPPRARFALRSSAFARGSALEIRQDGRALWSGRLRRLAPGRSAWLPSAWVATVDPGGGPIEVGLQERSRTT
jgi:hypothetical protein